MFIVYTDDCICFSKTITVPDKLIKDLKDDGFLLKDEGDARDFLGVTITRHIEQQTITMTQTGLIEQKNCAFQNLPAIQKGNSLSKTLSQNRT